MTVRVPTEYVIPVIDEYLANIKHEYPMALLSERMGVLTDTLWNIRSGRAKTVEIGFVDRLFCVMGNPLGYWLQEPFSKYYEKLLPHGAPPDPSKPVRCANPRCDVWFELAYSEDGRLVTKKKFCSDACQMSMYRLHNDLGNLRRKCWHCDEWFELAPPPMGESTRGNWTRAHYCSEECRVEKKRQNERERYARKREAVLGSR